MIKNITIENYKLFKSFHLEEIPRILLIGGKNNCGKTSFLEAVFFIFNCNNPDMFMRHLSWRQLNAITNNAESLLGPSFYNFNLDQSIIFEYTLLLHNLHNIPQTTGRKLSYRFQLPKQVVHKYRGENTIEIPPQQIIAMTQGASLGSVEIDYHLPNNSKSLLSLDQKGQSISNRPEQIQYNLGVNVAFLSSIVPLNSIVKCEVYGRLDRVNNTKPILEALKGLEPKLQSLSIIPIGNQPALHGDIGIGKKIPLSLMGQGIEHLLSILLLIVQARNGIALMDEIENGFHHSILPRIWEIIAKQAETNNVQIMATTHSRELIMGAVEGIPEHLREDFKYIRIDRDGDKFDPKIYNFENMHSALEFNLEVR